MAIKIIKKSNKRADSTQLALWAIKEATWELYGIASSKPGIFSLVKTINAEVDTTMRDLGYDPTWIIK